MKKPQSSKKKKAGIINSIMGRYRFDTIFTVDSVAGVITPNFNVIINNVPFNQGFPIMRFTSFGGLNLFNYVGRDIAGTWNPTTRTLTIQGFY